MPARTKPIERRTPIKRGKPPRKVGKHAYRAKKPAGYGKCVYCDRWGYLTNDHAVPRSINPGPTRDDPRGLVKACWECNGKREAGFKPAWERLPKEAQEFVVERIGKERARRYFVIPLDD